MYDVAIVGSGIAGLSCAARLQAAGLRTIVFEAHGQPGGCAGFFRRHDFAFDVGATTLVDFEPGGVGGELLDSIGMQHPPGESLPGYVAWLPDRKVTLHREARAWHVERLRALGDTANHCRFWNWMDRLATVFWRAARAGIKLPIQNLRDVLRAVSAIGLRNLPLARYMNWTIGDALRLCRLREDRALTGLLGMLLEDTVHAPIDKAPLINGALGITIRGAGLARAGGGMYGFIRRFVSHYRNLGGTLRVGCRVLDIEGSRTGFRVHTRRGRFDSTQVICAIPAALASTLGGEEVQRKLAPYIRRDASAVGGAVVVFLGVPEEEVREQDFTHHQLLQDYDAPLGNGNNMFVSVSARDDRESAPQGHRAVMISTHCELQEWKQLTREVYLARKTAIGTSLVEYARRVYPNLGERPIVYEVGTPQSYQRFTLRPDGAVGGIRQTLQNSNQFALPHDIGVPGFWMAGDTTWPGLGTVACVLGSQIVAELALEYAKHRRPACKTNSNDSRHRPRRRFTFVETPEA